MGLLNKYYFEKPEGQDIGTKIQALLKYSLPLSIWGASADIYFMSKCETFLHGTITAARWMLPINGAAIAYPSIVYVATRMRGKDDTLNHTLAGAAMIPILNAAYKLPHGVLVNLGTLIIVLATAQKGLRKGIPELNAPPQKIVGYSHQYYYSQ